MTKEQQEILNRVRLFMNYDMKKTLTENYQVVLNEQSDQNWKSKYPCVPKHPKAKSVKMSDGSTAYSINGINYYNNGRTSDKRNYNCKDAFFQYPKNQAEGDAFRSWFYKNYSNNPTLGNVAKQMGVDKQGPYNSKQLLNAWVLYGDDYLKSGGGKLTPDEIVAKQKKEQFDENGFLTIQSMNNILGQYNQKVNGGNEYDMPYIPCKTNDNVYAVYAIWFFQKINEEIHLMWNQRDEAQCKDNTFRCGTSTQNGSQWLSQLKETDVTSIAANTCICYNPNMVYEKPFDDILKDNLSSEAGKLAKYSLKGYNGIIPSFADIRKIYGTYNLKNLLSILRKTQYTWYYGETKNKKPSAKITSDEIHTILTVLAIGTAFIPVVGPLLSIQFGVLDAAVSKFIDNDPETAKFMLLMTILPELKIASNLFKTTRYVQAYTSLMSKCKSGQCGKLLTGAEKEFLEQIKNLDASQLSSEFKQNVAKNADELLIKNKKNPQLAQDEIDALKKVSSSSLTNTGKFITADIIAGIAPAFATKFGQDLVKRVGGLISNYMSQNGLENLDPKVIKQVTDALAKAAETTPEKENQIKQMDNLTAALNKNPKEFASIVEKPESREMLVNKMEEAIKKNNLEVLSFDDLDEMIKSPSQNPN